MPCPFVFKKKKKAITCIIVFRNEKARKLIKSRFLKVTHSSLKLGAFGHALSPLSGTSKNHSSLFQKKKKKKPFQKKSCISFQTKGIWLYLIQVSTNHIKDGQKSSNCLLQDFIR